MALDLDPYVKKLLNARRRVVLVNNILQNAQVKEFPANSNPRYFLIFKRCQVPSTMKVTVIFSFWGKGVDEASLRYFPAPS